MSQENVETIRAIVAAADVLEAMVERSAPDLEVDLTRAMTPFTFDLEGRDGIELKARGVWVWDLRDGRIARITLYQEPAEALEAAGLTE